MARVDPLPHQPLCDAVLAYAEARPPYAVLITGPWGSGKTHFWRHTLAPSLQNKRKKVYYLTLFGVNSIDDWTDRVIEAKLPAAASTIGKGLTTAIAGTLRYFRVEGLEKLKDLVTFNADTDVICVDDLERCGSGAFEATLGRISKLIEQNRLPVVIFANEQEIGSRSIYWRFKEKVIGQTFPFEARFEEAALGLSKDITSLHKETVGLLREDFARSAIAKLARKPNFRFLRIALERFGRLDQLALDAGLDLNGRCLLLYLSVLITWEVGLEPKCATNLPAMLPYAIKHRSPKNAPKDAASEQAAKRIVNALQGQGTEMGQPTAEVFHFLAFGLATPSLEREIRKLANGEIRVTYHQVLE